MTIITRPTTEKKVVKPLLVSDSVYAGSENINPPNTSHVDGCDVEMWLSPSTRRRISATTTVCIFVTALFLMSVGIIGGVYLYRQVTQHQHMSRFRGWCGIPYERDTLLFPQSHSVLGSNRKFFKSDTNSQWPSNSHLFREGFDLDLDTELFEKISVPNFGYGTNTEFLHDFKTNNTGIIFHKLKKCYVLPLDRRHIKPPRHLFDLVQKMWVGYYDVDTSVIRRRMNATPLKTLHSKYIANECGSFDTYWLEDAPVQRFKRSAPKKDELVVAEFAGQNIIELTIIEKK